MHTTATTKQPTKRTGSAPEDWLDLQCRHRLWNEREVLNVLADVSPAPILAQDVRRKKTENQLAREAPARREAVREHVDRAIANQQLQVNLNLRDSDLQSVGDAQLRLKIERAIYASTLYDDRYAAAPAEIIRWFFTDRDRFPRCRLQPRHLAIATAATGSVPSDAAPQLPGPTLATLTAAAGPTPLQVESAFRSSGGSPTEPAGREAVLQQRAQWLRREMERRDLNLSSLKPIDRKTVRKILQARDVSQPTLEKLARQLKVSLQEIPGASLT